LISVTFAIRIYLGASAHEGGTFAAILALAFGPLWRWMIPALMVHLWLVLMVIGSALTRLVSSFFGAIDLAQRYLKQGRLHPFTAIGLAAAAFVFVIAGLGKLMFQFA
jgi:hypothetical protein